MPSVSCRHPDSSTSPGAQSEVGAFSESAAVQVEGEENLPPFDQPAVYVANHQSFLVRCQSERQCSFSSLEVRILSCPEIITDE